tara:strand:+ start:378 stop:1337 length:960 start_codon:yes stop_codon:yes gene_type:complete
MFSNIINKINQKPPTILVIGDLMLDRFIYGNVDRISPEAPVPIVKLKKEEQMLGGCGNVIRNLDNLGVKTSLISAIGQDQAGDILIEKLLEKNISISGLLKLNDIRTTEKMRIVADRQQVVRVDWDMDDFEIEFEDDFIGKISKYIQESDSVIVSDYAKGVCSKLFLKRIIKISNDLNTPVFIDPKGSDWEKYKNANLITPNIKEAEIVLGYELFDDKDFEIAGRKFCYDYNIDACLITRGRDGMSFFSKDSSFHLKSNAREIYDVSGAGDTVISVMVTGLAMGLEYKEAADLANRAAGIVVGHIGTSAITTLELSNLS